MYSLGVILFELYNHFATGMERSKSIADLRERGHLAPLFAAPSDAGSDVNVRKTVMRLTESAPSARPSSTEVLRTSFTKAQADHVKLAEENRLLKIDVKEKDSRIMDLEKQVANLKAQLLSNSSPPSENTAKGSRSRAK